MVEYLLKIIIVIVLICLVFVFEPFINCLDDFLVIDNQLKDIRLPNSGDMLLPSVVG
jgi:hypothetical protein